MESFSTQLLELRAIFYSEALNGPVALHSMIFNTARDILIEQFKYLEGLGKYDFIPGFAIRGLHCDVQKSLLVKIDAFHYVQLGTAYRGLKSAPDEEVIELYGGMQHIPLYQISDFYVKGPSLKQFMDIFFLPEMTLLSSVIDYFITHGIEFDQVLLYKDVSDAIRDVHVKGVMCKWIEKDLEQYILQGVEIYAVLNRLVKCKKKLFLGLLCIQLVLYSDLGIPEQQKSVYPAQTSVGLWVGLTQPTMDLGMFPLFAPQTEYLSSPTEDARDQKEDFKSSILKMKNQLL